MAIFFPEFESINKLKQAPTVGELYALEILKGLSDDYEIYFQPFINGYIPDIVIVRKSFGVLIIEVKDWKLMHYRIDDNDNWAFKKENIPIKSPIKQVEAYKNDLYNISVPALLHGKIKDKKYYGIVQTAVYFHNENSFTISKLIKTNNYCPIFGNDNFCVEEIDKHRFMLRKYENKLFSDKIYKEFKRVLTPSFHTLEQAKEVKLSKKQELLVKSENKEQKIRGVAGSGKTLVLAQRAVNAHLRHGGKVLILTYNITLRNYIHDNLNRVRKEFHWNNFHIIHYDAFIISEANNHNIKDIENDDLDLFENVKNKIHKYQSIFIDEIQDYQEEWIRIIKKYFLVEGGEFIVFGDEKQNIYDKDLDNNKKPNTTIKGAWTKLEQSFRLSNNILKLAENFQNRFFSEKYELDKATPKQDTLDFNKENIEYFKLDNKTTLLSLSGFITDKIKENSIQPQDICILSQSNILLRGLDFEIRKASNQKTYTTFETHEMYQYLKEKKSNALQLENEIRTIRRNKRFNFWMNSGGIKLSTVHSFKGWEINTLFLIIDSKTKYETDEIIYTALTRCRSQLFVININSDVYDDFFKEEIYTKNIPTIDSCVPDTVANGNESITISNIIKEDQVTDFYYNFSKLKSNGKLNILVIGGITGNTINFKETINNHFSKFNIKAQEWDVEFWNNKIIKKKDIRCLKKGQSKFDLIITGQIHQHSSKGNKKANLLTELMKPHYVKRIYGCKPQDALKADTFVNKIDEYINKTT